MFHRMSEWSGTKTPLDDISLWSNINPRNSTVSSRVCFVWILLANFPRLPSTIQHPIEHWVNLMELILL